MKQRAWVVKLDDEVYIGYDPTDEGPLSEVAGIVNIRDLQGEDFSALADLTGDVSEEPAGPDSVPSDFDFMTAEGGEFAILGTDVPDADEPFSQAMAFAVDGSNEYEVFWVGDEGPSALTKVNSVASGESPGIAVDSYVLRHRDLPGGDDAKAEKVKKGAFNLLAGKLGIADCGRWSRLGNSDEIDIELDGESVSGTVTFFKNTQGETDDRVDVIAPTRRSTDGWYMVCKGYDFTRVPRFEIAKREEVKRLVIGPVLIPDVFDAQDDIATEEEVEEAAHTFMMRANEPGICGVMHRDFSRDIRLVESYILRQDLEIDGETLPKGTWMVGFKILDDDVWDQVLRGELRGFSMHGLAYREPV